MALHKTAASGPLQGDDLPACNRVLSSFCSQYFKWLRKVRKKVSSSGILVYRVGEAIRYSSGIWRISNTPYWHLTPSK